MHRTVKISAVCLSMSVILALGGCFQPQDESKQQSTAVQVSKSMTGIAAQNSNIETLDMLYAQAASLLFAKRQMSASSFGLSEKIVGKHYSNELEDYSPETEQALRDGLLDIHTKIQNFPVASLSAVETENKKIMANITRYFAGPSNFDIGYIDPWMGLSPFVVNQINGPIFDTVRRLQDGHKVTSEQDALDYVARLAEFDTFMRSVEAKFNADAEKGWLPPKIILQGARKYITTFTSTPPAENALVTSFIEKFDSLTMVSGEVKQELIERAINEVTNRVYPAYAAMAQVIELKLPDASESSGIWAQPKGDKYYQDAIIQLGDTNLNAQQIHQIGLDEVSRISDQMNSILNEQGYKEGTVGERMVALSKEARFLYQDSDEGRAALLDDVNGFINDITEKMDPLFKTKPSYKVEVRAYPKETQDSMPGGEYSPPPIDGSKPGIYWINLRDMEGAAKFTLKTLTYHEANPGHHWQISLNLEQDGLPFLQRVAPYNAFIEGWALYSEQIAHELGMYTNDPFGNLGRLQDELFRAVRLVVDTGLHYKKWTRQQAIDYMMQQTGNPESTATAEIERYMTWPGQALGYKLGMLKILALRETAKQALGDKFELAEFHDKILTGGAVPMQVLDAKINRWIKASQ